MGNLKRHFFRLFGTRDTAITDSAKRRGIAFRKLISAKTREVMAGAGVSKEKAEFIALLFNEKYYARHAPDDLNSDADGLLRHYLDEGMKGNLPPGPFFDPAWCHAALNRAGDEDTEPAGAKELPENVMRSWLETLDDALIIPTPLFDAKFYLGKYNDVRTAGMNPFYHFLKYGEAEGRQPVDYTGNGFLPLIVRERRNVSPRPLSDLLALFPDTGLKNALDAETWQLARAFFMPDFYRLQHGGVLDDLKDEQLAIHFYSAGIYEDFRPTLLFNAPFYRKALSRYNESLEHREGLPAYEPSGETPLEDIAEHVSPYMHWLSLGARREIVPTPLFSTSFYANRHKDLSKWKGWLFLHFAQHGCREKIRQPSPFFSNAVYTQVCGQREHDIIYLDYLERGLREGFRFSMRVLPDAPLRYEDDAQSTKLETFFGDLCKGEFFSSRPEVRAMFDKARDIEPLVARPYGHRKVSMLPWVHDNIPLYAHGRKTASILPPGEIDTLILLPHLRQLSGASRVGAAMARAVHDAFPQERSVMLLTDVHEAEKPAWLDDDLETADFAEVFPAGINPQYRQQLLLDVISGHKVKRIINVNSRLGWDLYLSSGRQMSAWMDLYASMFCWDKNERGDRGGYPIRELQIAFNDLKGVFFDTHWLRDEIASRYALPEALRKRLHVLLTPADPAVTDMSGNLLRHQAEGAPLRAFWAARFDRQKRLDVLFEIMRRMPEMELWMYGKSVLGGAGVDMNDMPENIRLQPPFKRLSDLPLDSFDFYLYTSEWDGLPLMIMHAGVNAMPTVASNVGGVGELITPETAWPVDDALDPEAYVRQIREMASAPDEAQRRAAAFRKRTQELCNTDVFTKQLKAILQAG